ncbi:hypothetical protein EYF80_066458 [Liparis tanakae]|uniref:Uncharacterized protein n=1 Tax=Liparis tanakae TaxID=230148 RepID=A0A4Z2E3X2_9TELE|nr:hypothetical protein EYF80_066458 [Liparis tanakae]
MCCSIQRDTPPSRRHDDVTGGSGSRSERPVPARLTSRSLAAPVPGPVPASLLTLTCSHTEGLIAGKHRAATRPSGCGEIGGEG